MNPSLITVLAVVSAGTLYGVSALPLFESVGEPLRALAAFLTGAVMVRRPLDRLRPNRLGEVPLD